MNMKRTNRKYVGIISPQFENDDRIQDSCAGYNSDKNDLLNYIFDRQGGGIQWDEF